MKYIKSVFKWCGKVTVNLNCFWTCRTRPSDSLDSGKQSTCYSKTGELQ